jgi:predicted nuclease of predicted toxin-antitoxin system
VRLLLDEHYSPKIAEALRSRGYDVVSATERDDFRGLGDRDLWTRASAEGLALMTEHVADFMPLIREAAAAGERHFGVVFTSPHSLPRSRATVSQVVELLDAFLRDRSADEALADAVYWLSANPR